MLNPSKSAFFTSGNFASDNFKNSQVSKDEQDRSMTQTVINGETCGTWTDEAKELTAIIHGYLAGEKIAFEQWLGTLEGRLCSPSAQGTGPAPGRSEGLPTWATALENRLQVLSSAVDSNTSELTKFISSSGMIGDMCMATSTLQKQTSPESPDRMPQPWNGDFMLGPAVEVEEEEDEGPERPLKGTEWLQRNNSCHHLHADVFRKVKEMDRKMGGATSIASEGLKKLAPSTHSCLQAPRCLVQLVASPQFQYLSSTFTFLYAVAIGYEADAEVRAALEGEDPAQWIGDISLAFNGILAFEVLLRVLAEGGSFFTGSDSKWNMFDLFLLIFCIFDMVSDGISVGFFRIFRTLKLVKALRIVRVLRVFRELRMMVAVILTSLASLIWSLVFLLVLTLLASCAILQGATNYLKHSKDQNDRTVEDIKTSFGDMSLTLYALIGCITGGTDWMGVARPLWDFGWHYGMGFIAFVLISVLGVLNVITGVFVERAQNLSKIDRDYAMAEHLRLVEEDVKESMKLYALLDPEGRGWIGTDEFLKHLNNEDVISYFSTLDIDVSDHNYLLLIFDQNENHIITGEEFVVGCVGMRGAARKADTTVLIMEARRIEEAVHHVYDRLDYIIAKQKKTGKKVKAMQGASLGGQLEKYDVC